MSATPQVSVRSTVTRLTLIAVVAACLDKPVAPDLVRPIAIVAVPAGDTLRVYDSVVLRVSFPPDGPPPSRIRWSLLARGDSTVADSLVFRPAGPGNEVVRAVAEFSGGAVGVAERMFVTRPNNAPVGRIVDASAISSARLPVGDTVVLASVTSDPDGDDVALRWTIESPDSAQLILGTTDTLRWSPMAAGRYLVTLEAADPGGARSLQRFSVEVYDPLTPSLWRRRFDVTPSWLIPGGLNALAQQPGGTVILRTPVGIVGIDTAGLELWRYVGAVAAGPLAVAPDGSVYFVPAFGTLTRLGPTGSPAWTLPPDSASSGPQNGPVVLADGSAVFAAFQVTPATPVEADRIRRIGSAGAEMWTTVSADCFYQRRLPAVGRDSTIYIQARTACTGRPPVLMAIGPEGTIRWATPLGPGVVNNVTVNPGPVAIADDSTVLAGADSLRAVRLDGTIRWVGGGVVGEIVVGLGVAYSIGAGVLRAHDLATGAELWQVSGVFGGPALTANDLVLVFQGHDVVGYGQMTGAEQWRHTMATSPSELLLIDAGHALVADDWGILEALPLAGQLNSPWPQPRADAQRSGRVRGP